MKIFLCRKALTTSVGAFLVLFILSCQTIPTEPARQLQSDVKKDPAIIISFFGDVIIHERLRQREESSNEGYQTIWSAVQKYIDHSDLSYANLEGPVAPEIGGVSGFPLFNFPEEIIPTLKKNGIDIVSSANNHALDRQARGVEVTIANLKKHNLAFSGTITSEAQLASKNESWWGLTSLQGSNLKVAWIACTEMTNGHVDKENQILYCFKNKEKIRSLVQDLKTHQEIAGIIITPHWGEEEKFGIENARQSWGQQLLNDGAVAVVGSHPHVIQKVENFKTVDGRNTFIAYSMGNFVSNQPWIPNKTSMMLLAKWKLNDLDKLELADLKYIALWMNRTVEKDNTAKYRISTVWDFAKMPADAVSIWKQQLGEERRLKSSHEADLFFSL